MRPIGIEMIAVAPVMSTVPQMACTAPPPSPRMPRIELEKKVPSKRAMPFEITVQATETSGTIATAKEAERSIIDIETLQHTNQQLISTLDEVLNIQKEGAAKRKEAEVELGKIEGELKQKLMELRS